MTDRKRLSVFELCVRRAAAVEPRRRARAASLAGHQAAFIIEWASMMRETGNDSPTVEEWAAWANVTERTAYRRLADFRLLFAEWHDYPTPLARHVLRTGASDVPAPPSTLTLA